MTARLMLRLLWWQSRGGAGRLAFLAACIGVGVAALVGVGALVDAVELGLRQNSRALLGGDLALRSRRPLPDVDPLLPRAYRDAGRVDVTAMSTMAQTPGGESRLVQLRAFDVRRGRFPLAGPLGLRPAPPFGRLSAWLDERSAVATPELLQQLGVKVGQSLRIGGQDFLLRAQVTERPQQLQLSFRLGPELWVGKAGLERAGLLGFGSRVRYRTLLGFPKSTSRAALAAIKATLEQRVPGAGVFVDIETHYEAQPALRATLQRVRRYLGLVALLSLLLGCVGVAQIISSWVARSAPDTAVLRCLGLRPRDVLLLHFTHCALTALVGSVAGGALGMGVPLLVAAAHPELIPTGGTSLLAWGALLRGVGVGTLVACVFSLPPLTAVYRVSPAAVLRSEADPLPTPRGLRLGAIGLAGAGLFAAALSQAHAYPQALAFTAGVGLLTALLWGGAHWLQRMVGRLPRRRMPVLLWQGAAALARPGAGTTGTTVALGLGTLVVLGISLVQQVVDREVRAALPADAPSIFMADIQPDQWRALEALVGEHGARDVKSAPVVMARIASVAGRSVAALMAERAGPGVDAEEARRAHWVLSREQRITWRRALPASNRITRGALWDRPGTAELSLEARYARDLGVTVGDALELDVQGVPMPFVVSSIREVQWRSFEPNFFLIAEPGYLDDAPRFVIGAMRAPAAREAGLQNAVTAAFPNVTVIQVRRMIERVASIFERVAFGVRLLGGFAMLTGLVILVGAVAASQLRRAREAALLKTLGVSRARVAAMFAIEYALRGLLAGLLGASGGYLLCLGFARSVLQLDAWPSLPLCAIAVLGTVALSVCGGLLASLRALRVPPLHVLRQAS